MATVYESKLKDKDAAHSAETMALMSVGDTFEGTLDGRSDVDWIKIELKGGMSYKITLMGDGANGAKDTMLEVLDSKGGPVAEHDDIDPQAGNLDSQLKQLYIDSDGTYYIVASSYRGNPNLDRSGDYKITVEELDLPAAVTGTNGDDKLEASSDDGQSIAGLKGDDVLKGGKGDDELDGGEGSDLLTGGPGGDVLMGGVDEDNDDTDVISYRGSMAGVSINLRSGAAAGGDAEGDKLGTDIEDVIGSDYDDMLTGTKYDNSLWGEGGGDVLLGDRNDDKLYGGAGDDELEGGDGDDTLEGGPGMDTLTGGDDDDTASYAGSMMGVTVRLHSGQAMGGDAQGDIWGDMVTVGYQLPDEDGKMVEYTETVPDIVHLTGSGNDDILAGDSRDNTIDGAWAATTTSTAARVAALTR